MSLIENRGPGIARNAGWNIAINPYVAFLDADDAWHPNKIKLQYQWMSEHPEVVMCGHGSMLLKENDSLPIIGSLPKPQVVGLYGMLWSNKIITRSVMLRRELTYRFEGKAVTEDYLLWLQMVADGLIVVKFNVPLAFSYRAEFSPGGYSGQLWRHEKRELNALAKLKQEYRISIHIYTLANIWSLVKYIRRVMKLIVAQYAKYE
jgi:glycosyltransferase involved in cell wall biosynthesis